jgi:hypothetical protein
MNTQEYVDRNLRLVLGNLQVELILSQARVNELEELVNQGRARIAELEAVMTVAATESAPPSRPNGKGKPEASPT